MRNLFRRARARALRQRAMTLAFSRDTRRRLLLVTQNGRIAQSQIFPFHFYADSLRRRHDVSVREASMEHVLNGSSLKAHDATTVAFQTHYDIPDAELEHLTRRLREQNPDARMVYLDWSAPTDLRNAARMNPLIDLYVKKHVLRDRSLYGRATLGDTNLADHYARRFGLAEDAYCFEIPPGFLDKLMVGPSFVTAPAILPSFLQPFKPAEDRPVDLHARFEVHGTSWYQAMRQEAEAVLEQARDLCLATGITPQHYRFMAELHKSKICFSPFGYGEVCWRDYEAIMAGAVLLKPDTGHIETCPDIFRPWETYVPVRWDLTDFNDALRRLLADAPLRRAIAGRAFEVLQNYTCSDDFADQMTPLFAAPR